MIISADFEKQKQYFDKKLLYRTIALSQYFFYRNIACQNRSSDEGLNVAKELILFIKSQYPR